MPLTAFGTSTILWGNLRNVYLLSLIHHWTQKQHDHAYVCMWFPVDDESWFRLLELHNGRLSTCIYENQSYENCWKYVGASHLLIWRVLFTIYCISCLNNNAIFKASIFHPFVLYDHANFNGKYTEKIMLKQEIPVSLLLRK